MNKIIHHTAIIYLSLIILIRIMAMPISLLHYAVNKNYISNQVCENRNRVYLYCFGKCYLNKQLTKANDSQESQNQKTNSKTISLDFFEEITSTTFKIFSPDRITHMQTQSPVPGDHFTGNIFHPPIA